MALSFYQDRVRRDNYTEFFEKDYWLNLFENQHGNLAFNPDVSDTLNTRAVAAAIAINIVFGGSYSLYSLEIMSGMSSSMFRGFVEEIAGAAPSVLIRQTLTDARTSQLSSLNLAWMLARKQRTNTEHRQAFQLFEEIAREHRLYEDATFYQAQLLEEGKGIDKDVKKAFNLYKASSNSSLPHIKAKAYFHMALLLKNTEIAASLHPSPSEEAVRLYLKAIIIGEERISIEAKTNLEIMSRQRYPVKKTIEATLEDYEQN